MSDNVNGTNAPVGSSTRPNWTPSLDAFRPLTVGQLLSAEQAHSTADFTIDGIEIREFTIVAHLICAQTRNMQMQYELEDGTRGRIVAKQWLDGGGECLEESDSGTCYVRIRGSLERFGRQPRNTIRVGQIRKADGHEYLAHVLEVFYVSLAMQFGLPPESASRSASRGLVRDVAPPRRLTPPPTLDMSILAHTEPISRTTEAALPHRQQSTGVADEPEQESQDASIMANERSIDSLHDSSFEGPSRTILRDPLSHLNLLERAILLVLLDAPPNNDVSVATIARRVSRQRVSAEEIGDALDSLFDEGYIEPTDIDEPTRYSVTSKARSFGVRYDELFEI
ncbi:uncharacterized protein LAESUDRAFT_722476 [Laetiporus sulphureus 93-53]|uniref:Nucleic acid-binding protein n=1 Tax=Laetiporus sulphureus 93-53 TaxID=1314785 RepID=A0A165FWQ3_9APHY|nr:uncharacterized protein LAESUDRAFT_722476 [Laetiporus sulphureus 93-53]KZT09512.1 hypothetical protein LAESUDRAFT_722476 [Laetiporus sulphureus 93-53]